MDREKVIIRVSIQGIVVNLILVAFKAFIGFMVNSIAIILDAVNNLSDAFSQIITIVGTKLSNKKPDKEHPFGYGRIEYISSIIIAAMILLAGATSAKESFVKMIHPEKADYSIPAIIIIAAAVVVKFVFGRYVKAQGEKVDAQSLIASGTDAFMDSILSFTTLVAAFVSMKFGISLEGILGLILSGFIIKAGFEVLMDTLGSLIGNRVDSDFSIALKKEIREIEGVNGAYDLVLHDYGPSRSIGTVHIEVDDHMTADEIQRLSRKIIGDVYEKHGIILTVGIYASNTNDPLAIEIKHEIGKIISGYEHIKQFHGFYLDKENKKMLFDMVISFKAPSAKELCDSVRKQVLELYPGYLVDINIDHDFSD